MRTALDGVAVGVAALATTTRGFTGQEQLGSLDVIHMNGRIYDPQLGRFLQADPLVAQPANPQNWNPYAYVFNNPLANTDPTGMFSVGQALGMIIGVVFACITQQYWVLGEFAQAFAAAAAGGFLSGVVSTGSLKQGVIGAFESMASLGIGSWSVPARIAASAVEGGVVSSLEGGKFGNGFVSAGLTTAVMPLAGSSQYAAVRSVEGALIGGTISRMTGGKFADGAISGAVQGAMEESETQEEQGVEFAADTATNGTATPMLCKGDGGVDAVYYARVKDTNAPALDALTASDNFEWAQRTWVSESNGKVPVTYIDDKPQTQGSHFFSLAIGPAPFQNNTYFNLAYYVHLHPAGSLEVNGADVQADKTLVLGKFRTPFFRPSSQDMMVGRNVPSFIVPVGSAKIFYIPPLPQANPNCYYELSR